MNSLIRITIVGTLALLISACASHSPRTQPQWIDGSSEQYPRSNYLTGIGQGADPESAKDRARADIAKIFKLNINVASHDKSSASFGADGSAADVSQTLSRQIQTSSAQIISGIEIADHWQDPTTRDYYALAVLPRHKARNSLSQDIRNLDDATATYLQHQQNENDDLKRVGLQWLALTTQQQRAERQAALQIVDLSGHGIEPKWSEAELKTELAQLQQQSSIAVSADSPALVTSLAGALTAAGFVHADDGAYELKGQASIVDLGKHDGMLWQRATIHIELSDAQGNIVGKDQWTTKGYGRDRSDTERDLQENIDKTLKRQLRPALLRFAAP